MSRGTMKYLLTLFLAGILMVSCAPKGVVREPVNLVFPPPPEKPRIKYIRMITNSRDVVKKKGIASAMDSLFGGVRADKFSKPYGVAVDRNGRIFVSDLGRIWMIDIEKGDVQYWGTKPGNGRISTPIGVAVSDDGRLFAGDITQDRVFVYNSEGDFVAAIGAKGELKSPSGIAIDSKRKRVYVVDSKKHFVNVYSLDDYQFIETIGGRGHDEGRFNFPTNIALNSEGNLYVVDTGNWRVQAFSPDGTFLFSFGQIGDVMGTFTRPKGIGIDSEDHVYVVDAAFQNIQVFDKEGKQFLMFFGGNGIQPGRFSLPAGMTIDHNDRIYVVDQLNYRLQIFQYLSEKGESEEGSPVQGEPPAEGAEKKEEESP